MRPAARTELRMKKPDVPRHAVRGTRRPVLILSSVQREAAKPRKAAPRFRLSGRSGRGGQAAGQ
jgi:hypothetical protein